MEAEKLKCCGVELAIKNLAHHRFIDCFKSLKFFRKTLTDGRPIKKEILLLALCPQCKHYVLKYLWYASKSARFWDFVETKEIRGAKADEVFERKNHDYTLWDIPNPYVNETPIKNSKKIPWVYYKTISDTEQIPRYIDESGDAGRKVYNSIKTTPI